MTPLETSELPVLDVKSFERTAAFLTPEAISSYFSALTERGETLLRCLPGPDAEPSDNEHIIGEAHTLAGSAGLLGFKRVADAGRRFEQAMQSGAAEIPRLTDELRAAIHATLEAIQHRTISALDA